LRMWHIVWRTHYGLQVELLLFTDHLEQVLDIYYADNIVDTILIKRHPAVPFLYDHIRHFLFTKLYIDSAYAGSRHHNLPGGNKIKIKYIFDQLVFRGFDRSRFLALIKKQLDFFRGMHLQVIMGGKTHASQKHIGQAVEQPYKWLEQYIEHLHRIRDRERSSLGSLYGDGFGS